MDPLRVLLERSCFAGQPSSWSRPFSVTLCLVALLFCSMTVEASSAKLDLIRVADDESVIVELRLTQGDTPPSGLQWTLQYSADDFVSAAVVAGPVIEAADKTVSCSNSPGLVTCAVLGTNTTTLEDGVVAIARFELSRSLLSSTSTVALTNTLAVSPQADELELARTSIDISISDGRPVDPQVPVASDEVPGARAKANQSQSNVKRSRSISAVRANTGQKPSGRKGAESSLRSSGQTTAAGPGTTAP